MKIKTLKEKSGEFLVFTKNVLRALEPQEEALNANIKYWLKKGEIVRLKKGLYLLRERYEKESEKGEYLEYIAGQLIKPSYLSVEYVLAKYQILSEPARTVTSITTGTTREINNNLAGFRYYSLSKKLFSGYTIKYFNEAPIAQASKSKALFDYLYLRFLKNKSATKEAVDNLRLNWENIGKKEFIQAKSYLKSANSKRLAKVFEIIERKYYV